MKKYLMLSLLSVSALSANLDEAMLRTKLEPFLGKVEILDSQLDGFKSVLSTQGLFLISNDGNYLIEGKVYELGSRTIREISTKPLMAKLRDLEDSFITYKAHNEKYVVNVFLDITCHYCTLLFKQVKQYNDLGITLRFLAFAREGLHSRTAFEMEALWTDPNPLEALKNHELHKIAVKNPKMPKVTAQHFELGLQFGIRGTPYLVFDDGQVIAGYLPPEQLLQRLQEHYAP